MKEFRIFYGVLTLIMFIMCFVYQSRLMPLLLLVLLICPVFSIVVMVINFFAIKLKVEPGETVAEKFEECGAALEIQNRFLFPVSPIRIIGDFQSLTDNETEFSKKALLTHASPLSVTKVALPFRLPFRGDYVVRIYEVHVYDLLKIFRLRRKLNLSVRIVVLPRDKHPNETGEETESDTESPASIITGHMSNVFNSLREYREGDSVRNIHWKLSAKQDELIVRQPEQSVNNSAVLFNDFSAKFDDDFLTRRMIDAVLETALAVTKKILLDGSSVINCWQGSQGSEKYELTEFSDYEYLYGAFTVLPQTPSEKGFDELIVLFSPEIKENHTIYVITPLLTEPLLQTLEESGLAMREDVTLILFTAVNAEQEVIDFIKEKTKINLVIINDESTHFNIE
jgi:hypothetical protein